MTTTSAAKKVVRNVSNSSMHWVGDGLPVFNAIDYNDLGKILNPFIMLDYGAPYNFKSASHPRGVGMHPHRGFETVTIAHQGEITHKDSTGATDTIHPGDVQWMTAGSGIEHSEKHSDKFTREGGTLEMLQLWVNLPKKHKMTRPGYQAITADSIVETPVVDGEGKVRIIAGEYNGAKGPASTFTPINLLDVTLKKGSSTTFTVNSNWVAAILVRRGRITAGEHVVKERGLIAFDRRGTEITVRAVEDAEFVVMAGEPIDEEYVAYGPMVMSTRDEIVEAFNDYSNGKFK